MIGYFIFAIVGKVCIFLLQKFPFSKLWVVGSWFRERGFLHDLYACDLCLGVWVFSVLAGLFRINLLESFFYLPVVSEAITGGITSILVHFIRVGYEAEYAIIEVK